MSIATLYFEELRATMRGRFAWVGTGVILLAVGCVATVGTQDTWLDGYGIIAYFLVPLDAVSAATVTPASELLLNACLCKRVCRFYAEGHKSTFIPAVSKRRTNSSLFLLIRASSPEARTPFSCTATTRP
jgi:hypothetical protein